MARSRSTKFAPTPLPFTGTDQALVDALRRGHPGAAASLFSSFERRVTRVVARLIGRDDDVPDLVHDVFVAALENVDKLRDASALGSWLEGTALMITRAHLRRRSRRRWLAVLHLGSSSERSARSPDPDASAAVRAFYRVLDQFPADDRVAFVERFLCARPIAEIAAFTGASVRTVHRRIVRAERRFSEAARNEPALADWLAQSTTFGAPPDMRRTLGRSEKGEA